jgi:hypothetical protein
MIWLSACLVRHYITVHLSTVLPSHLVAEQTYRLTVYPDRRVSWSSLDPSGNSWIIPQLGHDRTCPHLSECISIVVVPPWRWRRRRVITPMELSQARLHPSYLHIWSWAVSPVSLCLVIITPLFSFPVVDRRLSRGNVDWGSSPRVWVRGLRRGRSITIQIINRFLHTVLPWSLREGF